MKTFGFNNKVFEILKISIRNFQSDKISEKFNMAFKTMDDIEERKRKENREKMKIEISEDINDVIGNVFGKPNTRKRKTWIDRLFNVLKALGIIILLMIVINLILGNIWLLKFFMKSLFGIG